MGIIPLLIATGCYVWAAVDLYTRDDLWMALTFTAYALANIGLIAKAYL